MKRENINLYIAVLLIAAIIFSFLTIYAFGEQRQSAFSVSAHSAALYQPDNDIFLYSKNPDQRMSMASTTKIMTALVALEQGNLDDVVEIDDSAIGIEGSSAYLKLGDLLTLEELVYALLLQSANDAAVAIACHIGGSIEGFSALMNERAAKLSLSDTHFTNPHGLDDPEHYTTARELALIAAEALKNSEFKKIVSTYKRTFSTEERVRTYVNHNKLLRLYDGCIGVKTGFTKKSGRCLVGAAEKDGLRFISVTLDAPSDWSDHSKMLNLGYESLEKVVLAEPLDHMYKIPLIDGERDHFFAANTEGGEIIREKSDSVSEENIKLLRYGVAPINIGDAVGEIIYTSDGKEIMRMPIVALESVKKKKQSGFFDKILSIFD